MRISDWSSDVCSSDLAGDGALRRLARLPDATQPALPHAERRHSDLDIGILGFLRNDALPVRKRAVGYDHRARRHDLFLLQHHRSEEHTSELQSLMRISYAVFCLKKKKT